MPRITPAVYYNDSKTGLEFLGNAFGFKTRCKYPGPDGQIMHSELELEDGLIFVGQACEENRCSPANVEGKNTISLYVYVADVDAHCEAARAAGAEIVAEPADQFYGDRHYTAKDPEGHLWTFGQHIRDVSEEECLEAMKQMGGGEE